MLTLYTPDGSVLGHTDCFDPALTLDCGQAFRWTVNEDGCWRGIAFGRKLGIKVTDGGFVLFSESKDDFEKVWKRYFDFDRDYASLCKRFSEDDYLKSAIAMYSGIRVLRQEPWETLCSFIISQNNNIPRIKGIISRLCEGFGESLGGGDYAFPSAEDLARLDERELSPLRCGFRAKYIIDAAQKTASGEVRLDELEIMPIEEARAELMKIKGVGPKVAECTLLYGCGRAEAFPVDVWMKRVLDELYPKGLPACFDGYQGIAQQYLFHWRRNFPKS
jgi:N-glycosylase/DNA lyase